MDINRLSCLLISDFTVEPLSEFLRTDGDFPSVGASVAPFNQVTQVLIDPTTACWKAKPNFAVVWTRPEAIISSFNKILNYEPCPIVKILAEVESFAGLLRGVADRVELVFVPTWTLPYYQRGLGILNMRSGSGLAYTLMQMNLHLAGCLEDTANVYVLDAFRWICAAGKKSSNPKLWLMGKVAFGTDVFKEASADIKAGLRAIAGLSRKLIMLDLDDTLWGGIVGDAGWQNLDLGGHDPIGEAFCRFQQALRALTKRGILLGIVSKNDETVALEAINRHPEMVLRLNDFAGWKINWRDKPENIVDLVSDLNLGLQSAVFIDDSPAERSRVRESLPEVFVPEWPEDKMLYERALLSLRCFDTAMVGTEDRDRTRMYVSERQRSNLKKKVTSLEEWLKTLQIKVTLEELNQSNLQRVLQLLNKTNQMNLTTRRMTESELVDWAGQKDRRLWSVRVSDKFGDSGLTGIISVEVEDKRARIADFVLSCRVMGRKVEETMLYTAVQYARSVQLEEIYAEYLPTPKNKPCLEFWKNSGFEFREEDNTFTWNLKNVYPLPDAIEIENGKDIDKCQPAEKIPDHKERFRLSE